MRAERWHRRSVRLRGHDYASQASYFITLVTFGRQPLFGEISGGTVEQSEFGSIAQTEWLRTPSIRAQVDLDEFVFMPNHLHAIVHIRDSVGAHGYAPLHDVTPPTFDGPARMPRSLGSLVGGYKSAVTKAINLLRNAPGLEVWQRNYHEHIIRNDAELARIRQYIRDNPSNWHADPENPSGVANALP